MIVKNYFYKFLYYTDFYLDKLYLQEIFTVQYYYQQPQYYPTSPYPLPDPVQLRERAYKRGLRSTANGIGGMLLVFLALELILVIFLELILAFTGNTDDLLEMNVLYMLESGLVSTVIFFVAGLIYCLIKKADLGAIFPFKKVGGAMLYRLCIIGISLSLMGNYVVELLNKSLGLFGVQNNGGDFGTADNPDVLMYFMVMAIIPAFVEEFAFRGVVMGLLRPYSEGLAILVSSIAFALMHGNFVQMPFTFCAGLVFAYIDIKAGSLIPSIIVHFLNNGLSVLYDVVTSYEIVDEVTANMGFGLLYVVTGVLAFLAIRKIVKEKDGAFFELKDGDTVLPFKQKMKTVLTSPTMIIFAVLMTILSIVELVGGIG